MKFKCLTTGQTWPLSPKIIGCPEHPGPYSDLVVDSTAYKADYTITPLIDIPNFSAKYGFKHLLVKDESKNFTGSFKDRGAEELIKYLVKWKIKECFVVSCGNDALSTAAFAQKAGIRCTCIVPRGVNGSKEKLINLFGAGLLKESDNYEGIFRAATRLDDSVYNATGGYNCIKEEGIKKIAYEMWTDLPEIVVVPCGNGTLLWSIYKGFRELKDMKFIKKIPKLIGVQVRGAAPLIRKPRKEVSSIADGIVATESFSKPKVDIALKETGGEIIEVTDKEIIQSLKEIIKMESVIPEPTSASVFAGVKKLKEKNKKIVLILTAGGYKNLDQIASL